MFSGFMYAVKQNLLVPAKSRAARRRLSEYVRARARAHGHRPGRAYRRLFRICSESLADFEDCRAFGLLEKTEHERSQYLTSGRYGRLLRLINRPDEPFPRERAQLYSRFGPYLGREWRLISSDTPLDEIKAWAARHPVFWAQSPGAYDGREPQRISAGFFEDEFDLREYLVNHGLFLVEEYVLSHESLAALCPGAWHSVLVTVFSAGGRARVFGVTLQAGVSDAGERLLCPVCPDTGTVCGFGRLLSDPAAAYERHPDSGIPLIGLGIPHYERMLALCAELAAKFPLLPFQSFEFAAKERGAILLSISDRPDHRIHQVAQGKGLYPEFAALAREYVRQAERAGV